MRLRTNFLPLMEHWREFSYRRMTRYFDLLPGQTVEIAIRTAASEDALRSGLKVISLVDAFNQDAAAKQAAASGVTGPN